MSKLQELLQQMIDETMRDPNPVTRKLANGLHITIQAGTDTYTIALSRDSVYPSVREWETVIKHFPYFVAIPNAKQCVLKNKRLALLGRIPKRQQQALRLL